MPVAFVLNQDPFQDTDELAASGFASSGQNGQFRMEPPGQAHGDVTIHDRAHELWALLLALH
jgi:hypothetical protein